MASSEVNFWIVILVAGGLIVVCYFSVHHLYRWNVFRQFEAARIGYLEMRPDAESRPNGGSCKGNFVTIDSMTRQFDPLFFDLPNDLKAPDSATVNTIVFLTWKRNKVGEYSDRSPMIRHQCYVELVDRESKALLRRDDFLGSQPPQFKGKYSSGEGSLPTEEVIGFLQASMQK